MRAPKNSSSARPSNGALARQPHVHRSRRRGRVPAVPTELRRSSRVHLPHRVVELTDTRESGRERDVGETHVRGLDEDARGLRTLGTCEGERRRAELLAQHACEVAFAVAEPAGQPGHPLAIDDAVGDEPNRVRGHVAAYLPFGRTGHRVGPAALARVEPTELGRRGTREEAAVLGVRRHCRAARPAVDARARHAHVEHAVEARVPPRDGAVTEFGIAIHPHDVRGPVRYGLADSGHHHCSTSVVVPTAPLTLRLPVPLIQFRCERPTHSRLADARE